LVTCSRWPGLKALSSAFYKSIVTLKNILLIAF
jgi:hypothetical protein